VSGEIEIHGPGEGFDRTLTPALAAYAYLE
jgi:hypothetical protein